MYKRIFDIAGAIVILCLLSPLLLVISIAVKVTSSGPILFRQKRIGKDNTLFTIVKFRTLKHEPVTDEPVVRGDPRMTRLGRILRRYYLDELPQLVNVIRGDMSLIGPRPFPPCIVSHCFNKRRYDSRLAVRPGLTGLMQLYGREFYAGKHLYGSLRLDAFYVKKQSWHFDLWILWKTIGRVIAGTGV